MSNTKSFLVLGTPFFGYIDRICDLLKSKNYNLDCRYTYTYNFASRIIRLIKCDKILNLIIGKYYDKLINSLSDNYDKIVVINGNAIPPVVLEKLKSVYSSSKFILYIWDDINRLPYKSKTFLFFDKIYTYSLSDSKDYNLEYLPFFYSEVTKVQKSYDISFIGTLHGKRHEILNEIEKKTKKLKIAKYFYSDPFSYFKNYLLSVPYNEVNLKKLPYSEYIKLLSASKATIEIPDKDQKNITTRPIECLSTRTKLITTSESIKGYDFYNEVNIFILNGSNYDRINDWLCKPYHEYDKDIMKKYSLESWIDEVFFSV